MTPSPKPGIHFNCGMGWRDGPRTPGPPFRYELPVPTPKPRVNWQFWRGVLSVAVFYAIGAAILIEVFRPALVQCWLHGMGVH